MKSGSSSSSSRYSSKRKRKKSNRMNERVTMMMYIHDKAFTYINLLNTNVM